MIHNTKSGKNIDVTVDKELFLIQHSMCHKTIKNTTS